MTKMISHIAPRTRLETAQIEAEIALENFTHAAARMAMHPAAANQKQRAELMLFAAFAAMIKGYREHAAPEPVVEREERRKVAK